MHAMESVDGDDDLSVVGEPTISVTTDFSLINHEKDLLLERTKTQENEIMGLRLKVEAFEKEKQDATKNSEDAFTKEEKTALDWEISVLRGKVALLERNNKIFSNEERTELKQELERTKRRFKNLNQQLASIRNSMEYDHINHVERAMENFVKKVKSLEKENNDLRKKNAGANATDEGLETCKMIEDQEETIKDQEILIEELQHRIKCIMSREQDREKFSKDNLPPPIVAPDVSGSEDVLETNRESPRKSHRSSHGSPRRTARSRLSSRSGHAGPRKDPNSTSSSGSSQGSDSDARAIRAMCGKMREDIEEAKQKLKDMGDALDVPPHSSPMHFPLKVYGSPVFDGAATDRHEYEEKSSAATSPRRSAREQNTGRNKTVDDILQISPRQLEETVIPSESFITARPATNVASARLPAPPGRSPRSSRSRDVQQKSHQPSLDELRLQTRGNMHAEKASGNFLHLLCRYEFLRFRSMDHRLLEAEQECAREDLEQLMKLRRRRKTKESEKDGAVGLRTLPPREYLTEEKKTRKNVDASRKTNGQRMQYHETTPLKQYPTVPSSYASIYALSENDGLRAALYRVYIAKREYVPEEEIAQQKEDVFPKIRLRLGDVATSLGAPETREDGQKYQLVEVNDKIGFVPLSYLQLAEQVHDAGRNRKVTRGYLTSTLRRIPDLHRRLHDRRRIMHCGV